MDFNFKTFKLLSLLFLFFYFPVNLLANHISGKITDNNGEALPFASVYLKNSTYGVSANSFGEYFMEINSGKHVLVFSSIGYKSIEKSITVNNNPLEINTILQQDNQQLFELEIVSNTKNKALEIIHNKF